MFPYFGPVMCKFTKEEISLIQKTLSKLHEQGLYERREPQAKLLNDIRLTLNSDKPVFAFESSIGLGRKLAYLLASLVRAKLTGKQVVVSTSNLVSQQAIFEQAKKLQNVLDFSFEVDLLQLGAKSIEADLHIITHSDFANGVIFGGNGLLPRPTQAIYIFEEAHRLEEMICEASKSVFSFKETYELLDSLNVNTDKVTDAVVQLHQWVISNHSTLFVSSSNRHFEKGILPTDLYTLLDKTKFLIDQLGMSQDKLNGLSELSNNISGLLQCAISEIPLAKWVSFSGEDNYSLSVQPISVADIMERFVWSSNCGVLLTSSTLQMVDNLAPSGVSHLRFLNSLNLDYSTACVSSYEYQPEKISQSTLSVPNIPFEVTTNEFLPWLKHSILNYCDGHTGTVVLFSSVGMMESVRNSIEATCTTRGILIQCQGDRNVEEITVNHNKAIALGYRSIIFGLMSVFEALGRLDNTSNVLLIKLPFSIPDVPHLKAKCAYEETLGRLSFYSMTLPQVSIDINQCLLRTAALSENASRCVIFDRRIVNKLYGESLIQTMPPLQLEIEN